MLDKQILEREVLLTVRAPNGDSLKCHGTALDMVTLEAILRAKANVHLELATATSVGAVSEQQAPPAPLTPMQAATLKKLAFDWVNKVSAFEVGLATVERLDGARKAFYAGVDALTASPSEAGGSSETGAHAAPGEPSIDCLQGDSGNPD